MTRKDIRTGKIPVSCDVCGRTMLPGEEADIYLAGGQRRNVCELCGVRAAHQGWIRESAVVELPENRSAPERRPLFELFRSRRERREPEPASDESDEALDDVPAAEEGLLAEGVPGFDPAAEPRHVHAVPASGEMKAAEALQHFNATEHRKTVAGVARSLGVPTVSVASNPERPSVVKIVVSWELCWYRYEVDLADGDGVSGVRLIGQGYELEELEADEQTPNATSDDSGALALAGAE